MDIFDKIFAEKLEEYLGLEREKYNLTEEQREAQMFNFA